jgi:hypothetical protein
MRKCATVIAAVVALLVGFGSVGAQGLEMGVRVAASPTLGDYGARTGETAGGAPLGYSAGVDFGVPLAGLTPALSWYTSAGAVWHAAEAVMGRTGSVVSGRWLHVPVVTGLRYELGQVAPSVSLSAQGGLMLSRAPAVFYPLGMGAQEPQFGANPALTLGVGFRLTDHLSLGARYHPRQTMEFQYSNTDAVLRQDVSFLEIYMGLSEVLGPRTRTRT